jgi:hypothetical protein
VIDTHFSYSLESHHLETIQDETKNVKIFQKLNFEKHAHDIIDDEKEEFLSMIKHSSSKSMFDMEQRE